MAAAKTEPLHQDWSSGCVGTIFQTVVAEQPSFFPRVDVLHAYPTPTALAVVLDTQYWTWRESDPHTPPFLARPLLIWELLVELIIMFHFHFFDADKARHGEPHVDQLMAFLAETFRDASFVCSVPPDPWHSAISKASALMLKHFTVDAFRVQANVQNFRHVLNLCYDRRYHLASGFPHCFPIQSSRSAPPKSRLFAHLPGKGKGKVPYKFVPNSSIDLCWDRGQLILDFLVNSRTYVCSCSGE